MARNDNIIVGLDIGTTKISALVAEVTSGNEIKVIGVGRVPSKGLRQGVVVNFEHTVTAISQAIEAAEVQADVAVQRVFAGIAGDHIRSVNSRGVIAVSNPSNEITRADVQRVVQAARQVGIPMDRQIIHTIPQEFIVDDQGGIREPVGLSGIRLEAIVHIVTGAVTSAHNIIKCVKRAGFEVADLVLEPIASSHAVLSDDEEDLGVILVDIGGGTTDYTIFYQGAVRHSGVVAIGGDFVTRDLAYGLRTTHGGAEALKRNSGCCFPPLISDEETIGVVGLETAGGTNGHSNGHSNGGGAQDSENGGVNLERLIRRQVLADIITPRMEEIFTLVRQQLRRSEYLELASGGMVLTGGASQLFGAVELAERIFQMPVRRGAPRGVIGLTDGLEDPSNATGIGLLHYAAKNREARLTERNFRSDGIIKSIFGRMRKMAHEWF